MNTETLNERKINLIVRITKLDKEDAVRKIEETIDDFEGKKNDNQLERLKNLSSPIRRKTDVEELKREQNWKPTSGEKMRNIVKDFDWQISDEEFFQIIKDD